MEPNNSTSGTGKNKRIGKYDACFNAVAQCFADESSTVRMTAVPRYITKFGHPTISAAER